MWKTTSTNMTIFSSSHLRHRNEDGDCLCQCPFPSFPFPDLLLAMSGGRIHISLEFYMGVWVGISFTLLIGALFQCLGIKKGWHRHWHHYSHRLRLWFSSLLRERKIQGNTEANTETETHNQSEVGLESESTSASTSSSSCTSQGANAESDSDADNGECNVQLIVNAKDLTIREKGVEIRGDMGREEGICQSTNGDTFENDSDSHNDIGSQTENEHENQSESVCQNVDHNGTNESINKSKLDSDHDNADADADADIYAYEVLNGAIQLFARQNQPDARHSSTSNVVNYLPASQMMAQLFSPPEKEKDDDNDEYNVNNLSLSLRSDNEGDTMNINMKAKAKVQRMIQCFRSIQEYSVNTNHPYFFNQLFGAVDPIALAAELIALSVNTSAYTWETAPVFTLMERDVLSHVHRLVYMCNDLNHGNEDDSESEGEGKGKDGGGSGDVMGDGYGCSKSNNGCEGLMLPGGSLSNLTALHVARHYVRYGTRTTHPTKQSPALPTPVSPPIEIQMHASSTVRYANDEEEKKEQDVEVHIDPALELEPEPQLVAFVSSEAHYSFTKAVSVTGIGTENLIVVPTLPNGQMDVEQLDLLMMELENQNEITVRDGNRSARVRARRRRGRRIPFFVAVTSGSTVRGSFDDIEAIVRVCRKHEDRMNVGLDNDDDNDGGGGGEEYHYFNHDVGTRGSNSRTSTTGSNQNQDPTPQAQAQSKLQSQPQFHTSSPYKTKHNRHKIWIHVDGAWGGSAIFSSRRDIRCLMKGVHHVDSFTFNPHKMLGAPQQTTAFVTRHEGILKAANSSGAKYLFDQRKNGAEYDLGDASYTCGRRTDAIKLWALWKYHGPSGIGKLLEDKVDALHYFVKRVRERRHFMLACHPWPFNVNFFYIPERIRQRLHEIGIETISTTTTTTCTSTYNGSEHHMDNGNEDDNVLPSEIPTDISEELAKVSVELKLRLHQSGEMLIPYQPLSNQKADCFRIVLAGYKPFGEADVERVLDLMERYGHDL